MYLQSAVLLLSLALSPVLGQSSTHQKDNAADGVLDARALAHAVADKEQGLIYGRGLYRRAKGLSKPSSSASPAPPPTSPSKPGPASGPETSPTGGSSTGAPSGSVKSLVNQPLGGTPPSGPSTSAGSPGSSPNGKPTGSGQTYSSYADAVKNGKPGTPPAEGKPSAPGAGMPPGGKKLCKRMDADGDCTMSEASGSGSGSYRPGSDSGHSDGSGDPNTQPRNGVYLEQRPKPPGPNGAYPKDVFNIHGPFSLSETNERW